MKLLLITLSLCCAAPLSAVEAEPAAEPAAWHVAESALRVPVSISPKSALRFLSRTPPDV